MDFDTAMKISGSGMSAQRAWMTVLSSNLANVNTTKGPDGKPYARRTIIFEATPAEEGFNQVLDGATQGDLNDVKVADIVPDGRDFKEVYDPGNPDADAKGMVRMPNISPIEEMTNLLSATRAYEANLTALNNTKNMAIKALDIGK
jgi:flagellar basal-body rod protein FlgC